MADVSGLINRAGKLAYTLLARYSNEAWARAPRPPDARAVCRGPGHDPDRVLLAGNGVAVGWGVVRHDLGLAGHLARGTSAATQRGTDVEVYAHHQLYTSDIIEDLTPARISRYDAIVLTVGVREWLELLPARHWRQQLIHLLDHISAGRQAAPAVILVGVPEDLPETMNGTIRSIARTRARALNDVTREVVATRSHVQYVAGPPLSSADDFDADATYDRAARGIIPLLADALDHSPHRVKVPVDEEARLAAVEFLQTAEVQDDPRIHQLLATAKDVLHAHSVDLFFVDRDEVRLLAATNETALVAPRAGSLSNEMLEYRNGYVIPDLTADPRHAGRVQVVGPPYLRFYAAHPVESPHGHRVGVLAVVDTKPRDFTSAERSLLRHFALRAGTILFDR